MKHGDISNRTTHKLLFNVALIYMPIESKKPSMLDKLSFLLGIPTKSKTIDTNKLDIVMLNSITRIFLKTDYNIKLVSIGQHDHAQVGKYLKSLGIGHPILGFDNLFELRDYIDSIASDCLFIDNVDENLNIVGSKAMHIERFQREVFRYWVGAEEVFIATS